MEPGLYIVKHWGVVGVGVLGFYPCTHWDWSNIFLACRPVGFKVSFYTCRPPQGGDRCLLPDYAYHRLDWLSSPSEAMWVLQSPPEQHGSRPPERCLQSPSWWHTQQESMKRTISTLEVCVHSSVLNLQVVDNFCSFVTFHRPPCAHHFTELPTPLNF